MESKAAAPVNLGYDKVYGPDWLLHSSQSEQSCSSEEENMDTGR